MQVHRLALCIPYMHNAIMTSITIRDIPNETHAELMARAALSGQSLQEFLRSQLVELARRPDPKTLMEQVRRRKQNTPSLMPAERILDYRDRERR
jgi:plasmid stability protein